MDRVCFLLNPSHGEYQPFFSPLLFFQDNTIFIGFKTRYCLIFYCISIQVVTGLFDECNTFFPLYIFRFIWKKIIVTYWRYRLNIFHTTLRLRYSKKIFILIWKNKVTILWTRFFKKPCCFWSKKMLICWFYKHMFKVCENPYETICFNCCDRWNKNNVNG